MLNNEVDVYAKKFGSSAVPKSIGFHQMELVLRFFLVLQTLCHVNAVDLVFHGKKNFGKLFAFVQISTDVAKVSESSE